MVEFGKMMSLDNAASIISEWESCNAKPTRKNFYKLRDLALSVGIDLNAINGHPEIYRDPFTELIQKQDSAAWVRRIRKQYGLSVEAFARYLDVSRNAVWQWESDQIFRKPSRESFSKIVEIAKMRGVDIYDPWRTETLADTEAPV